MSNRLIYNKSENEHSVTHINSFNSCICTHTPRNVIRIRRRRRHFSHLFTSDILAETGGKYVEFWGKKIQKVTVYNI